MFVEKDRMIFLFLLGLLLIIIGIIGSVFSHSITNIKILVTLVSIGGGMGLFSTFFLFRTNKKNRNSYTEN